MAARFAVGIDLGTTHTVVAWAPLDAGASETRVFDVSQIIAHGQMGARPLFPSALYAPLEQERGCGFDDPFGDAPWVLGEHARRRGAEVPGRVVASSKSWLVHPSVDRTAAILPWDGREEVPKVSPVDAAARLLSHVRRAWDVEHEDAPLPGQEIVLTVPASFDEVGRELTIEAARRAGIAPILLEEPQAAFYDWMTRVGRDGVGRLLAASGGEALVLVVDAGGGTTDLSLVRVSDVDRMTRVAVGPHLLLGGDNMDLALAHACEPALVEPGAKLDAARFVLLVAACRVAKESLLGPSAPVDAPVTILGGGAHLVGNVRTTRLTREAAEHIVLDGFLPLVAGDARPQRARGGITALGLPYERDPAITKHVAAFLARHLPAETLPDAVLLAGGVFRAPRMAGRLVATISGWRPGSQPIERLLDSDPELAVARGAVAYALARRGQGVRIRGGT
ncbi:MAG: Hsp70 family protein, partial [Myxococcota bacterium]|nr:Hsp70 family protein [Myxococcota bacterium]